MSHSESPPDDRDRQDLPETGSSPDPYRGPYIRTNPLSNVTTYAYYYNPQQPHFEIRHDRDKRVFEATGPDGHKSAFHDRAVRFLVVKPDPETGELRPVTSRGKPEVVHLCREAGLYEQWPVQRRPGHLRPPDPSQPRRPGRGTRSPGRGPAALEAGPGRVPGRRRSHGARRSIAVSRGAFGQSAPAWRPQLQSGRFQETTNPAPTMKRPRPFESASSSIESIQ